MEIGLRESLAGEPLGPGSRAPSPHPPFSSPSPSCAATGTERPPLLRAGGSSGLASRGDRAKALVSSAKPRALEVRDGEGPGPWEQTQVWAAACPAPGEATLGHIPVSAQGQGEKTGSEPEEGSERSSGEDVGEEGERQVGSVEVMVIEGGKGHPEEEESGMKEEGGTRNQGRGFGGHAHGPFLWGGAGEAGNREKLHKELTWSPDPSEGRGSGAGMEGEGIYRGYSVGDGHPAGPLSGLQAHFGPPPKRGGAFSQSFDQLCIRGS